MDSGSPDMLVVTSPLPGIDPEGNLAAAEHFTPLAKNIEIVERQPDTALEAEGVFLARREIRCEQDALPIDVGKLLEHALDFASRNAFEVAATCVHGFEHGGVVIGLHRVKDRVD